MFGKTQNIIFSLILIITYAPVAYTCCTSSLCDYCVQAGNSCFHCDSCTTKNPVICPTCNVFGCSCNPQCGCGEYSFPNDCYYRAPCPSCDQQVSLERFRSADLDNDGRITLNETFTWVYGYNITSAFYQSPNSFDVSYVVANFHSMDVDSNGYVTYPEFDSTYLTTSPLVSGSSTIAFGTAALLIFIALII